jgi:hypothetical protein
MSCICAGKSKKGKKMQIVLIVLLVLLLAGAFPIYGWAGPYGLVGTLLIIVLILALLGAL